MGLMLLFGGTCFAQQQEEFQRDSVWGLEWNLQDSILTVSFMSSCDGFKAIRFMSFKNGVYDGHHPYEISFIANSDGDIIFITPDNNPKMSVVSCAIDTLSEELTRYTISASLNSIYLTIPQDISTYCGYFGIVFDAKNHDAGMYEPFEDLTKDPQFLYFNLLDTLTSSEEYRQEEEFQRDSVWGLEWNLQDSILTVSFMSSCDRDGYTGILLTSYKGGDYRGDPFDHETFFLEGDGGMYGEPKYTPDAAMSFVSLAIDTLSTRLTRYTLVMKLGVVYLTIPQDISSYRGYFGVTFLAPNHDLSSYGEYMYHDLTQCSQFLYFNLLGSLTWNEDYKSDPALCKEVYYSMAGVPLRNMPENEPVIVVKKDANDRIVSSKVRIWRP